MGNEIRFTFSAEGKQMALELQKQEKQIERLQDKMAGLGKAGKDSFSGIGKEMSGVVQGLIGPLGVAGAVTELVATVKHAYAAMREEHRGFMRTIETTSEARSRYLYAAAGVPGGKEGAEALAGRVAAGAGIAKGAAYDILTEAVTKGGTAASPKAIESAAIAAGRLQRQGLGQGSEFVGRAMDLAAVTGNADAGANLGYLRQVGAAAGISGIAEQGELVPVLRAATLSGDSAEQAGELTAAVSSMSAIHGGRPTANAVLSLMEALDDKDLLPGKRKGRGKIQGANTMERLAQLQAVYARATPAQREAILAKIGGGRKMQPTIEAMVANTGEWQATLATAREKIAAPGSAGGEAAWNTFAGQMDTGAEGVVGAEKTAGALLSGAAGEHVGEASDTTARDLLLQKLKQQGMAGQMGAAGIAAADPYLKLALLAVSATTGSPTLVKGALGAGVPTAAVEAAAKAGSGKSDADQAFFEAVDAMRKGGEAMQSAADKIGVSRAAQQEID